MDRDLIREIQLLKMLRSNIIPVHFQFYINTNSQETMPHQKLGGGGGRKK